MEKKNIHLDTPEYITWRVISFFLLDIYKLLDLSLINYSSFSFHLGTAGQWNYLEKEKNNSLWISWGSSANKDNHILIYVIKYNDIILCFAPVQILGIAASFENKNV